MHRSAIRRVLTSVLSLMLLGGAFAGCDCGTPPVRKVVCTHNDCCKTDQDCFDLKKTAGDPDPSNWACNVEDEACRIVVQSCILAEQGDTNCCPGQACSMITEVDGICGDKMVSCTEADSSACSVKGQYCEMQLGTNGQKSPGCTFRTCQADADCSDGLSCFNGSCVGEPPCRGGCPSGSVCTPVTNQCYRLQDSTGSFAPVVDASCQQTCAEGLMLVFSDPTNTFGLCDPKKECQCLALPPIRSNDTARFSSSVVAGTKILVSAYDGDHGDLVLHTYAKGENDKPVAFEKTEWVDGVPTSGALTGDPKGPRGGREAAGPDVGQFTSIAFDSSTGAVHISYYAVKDGNTALGNLKYARRINDGEWTIFDVDGVGSAGNDTGDVGLYSNITLAPDGAPVIAYFQKGGTGPSSSQTAVKVARAKGAAPTSAADWVITTVETGTRKAPPCNASCKSDEVCADVSSASNGSCIKKSAADGDCKPGCKSTEFCGINGSSQSVCYTSLRAATLAGIPEGNGLFTTIAYYDSKPVVVWYDHTKGQLKGVIATADSPSQGAAFKPTDIIVLDNGVVGTQTHDVGQFTSIAVGPAAVTNRIAVSYMDGTSRQLRVLTAGAGWAGLTAPEDRIVDTGAGDPVSGDALLFVGADSSVRFNGNSVSVVYQDSTGGDLRLAEQNGGTGPLAYKQTLAKDGACGFYAKLIVDGTSRYATHAIIKARQGNGSAVESANRLDVLKLP